MALTWAVRLPASWLTLSVRRRQVPAAPGTFCLAAELALGADFARDPGDLGGEGVELIHHHVDGVFQLEDLASDVNGDLLRQVAIGNGGGYLRDISDLGREVAGKDVDVVGQVLPDAGHAFDPRLAAKLAVGADLLGDAGDFRGEGA
jgi:hypothetical protein